MNLCANKKHHQREQGQTLALVALSLAVLISLAALAIDLTSLYVARGEMQRAADAAALAGAKAFVESGTTTAAQNDLHLQALAQTIGTAYINASLLKNTVGGVAPVIVGAPTYDFGNPGNPKVTVTLQRTDVPTFFARIFGRRLVTVQATAIAEAYNSSNPPGGGGANMPPVAPSCVKPWLIPNVDPSSATNNFINETDGTIVSPGVYPTGVIGERIQLQMGLGLTNIATTRISAGQLYYFPTQLTSAVNATCPSCAGASQFEQSSACCDSANDTEYSNACGTSGPGILIDVGLGLATGITQAVSSTECLIGATGPGTGAGQDELGLGPGAQGSASTFGNFLADNGNDPIEIRSGSGFHDGQLVNTSPSIVTLPIYRVTGLSGLLSAVQLHIIGYMQAFVEQALNSGEIDIYVLNISGCGTNVNPALTPITGGGVSPVPVRLIHN